MRVVVQPKKWHTVIFTFSSKRRSFHIISSYPHVTSGSAETGYGTPTKKDGEVEREQEGKKYAHMSREKAEHSRPPSKSHDS